ncbi:hypothetical protein [Rhizobium sp. LC145]|uniref:hypothetical protein n=1 Tax=Rhizobium sp. LC145 TaxID=1120688 RepID=UPI00062A4F2C|nr:hypothetical protein [Rhizobium sp. LC145]KKX29228.1 hypothetical protein YH62_15630 [Rhizobium sp. LC145]TKT68827.1 hypothetical protein FDR95_00160 [Rhizobiaceae bacterium LC148]
MSEALVYLIKKGSYFYRPNKQGYTSFKFDAGRYTKDDAEAEAAIEPWHMKAVHQDEVPDDTAPDRHVAGLQAKIDKAGAAIKYLLDRSQRDDKLYYQIGFGTEAFRLLTDAHAALTGQDVKDVEARYCR